jgi:uncharacterized protein
MILTFIVIMIFVVIQSIYGAGLLIFGVPFLIIYGLDYFEIVGLLLPSSIIISMLQLFKHRNIKIREEKLLPLAFLGIIIGLGISILASKTNLIPTIIGILMLFSTLLRTNPIIRKYTVDLLIKHRSIFHLINSILHGFSNLGGILLTFYSTSVYHEKIYSVRCTALFYLVYATSQMIVLFCIGKGGIFLTGVFYMPFTALCYLLLGEKTFRLISQHQFDTLATVFFFFAGFLFLFGPEKF